MGTQPAPLLGPRAAPADPLETPSQRHKLRVRPGSSRMVPGAALPPTAWLLAVRSLRSGEKREARRGRPPETPPGRAPRRGALLLDEPHPLLWGAGTEAALGWGHRAGFAVAQDGWGLLVRLRAARPGSPHTQRGSEPGVGREALPAARWPPAHKGPIVWLRLWAAGGCLVPHGEALPPAARAEEGTAGTGRVGARVGRAGPGRSTHRAGPAA